MIHQVYPQSIEPGRSRPCCREGKLSQWNSHESEAVFTFRWVGLAEKASLLVSLSTIGKHTPQVMTHLEGNTPARVGQNRKVK
ncbi:MAG TPA: hypothetical protein V6D03_11370 [Candidatus Caenarcaniphilales bacterium]